MKKNLNLNLGSSLLPPLRSHRKEKEEKGTKFKLGSIVPPRGTIIGAKSCFMGGNDGGIVVGKRKKPRPELKLKSLFFCGDKFHRSPMSNYF
jgi:hypothetical protein